MMKGYNLYGLRINTTLDFAFQQEKKPYKNPNATVLMGKVKTPAKNLKDTYYRSFTSFSKTLYFQEIPTIAKYLIDEKGDVTIEAYPNQDARSISIFFIDSVLPILLMKNNIFPIRASAIRTHEGIYLFACPRGIGKSALATYFCLAGSQLIGDNLITLKWQEDKKQFVTRCYDPYVTLWRDVLPIFEKEKDKFVFTPVRKDLLKFKIDFSDRAYKRYDVVKAIIQLKFINFDQPLRITELKGYEKIDLSKKMVQYQDIAAVISKHKSLFKFTSRLASNLKIYQLERSKLFYPKEISKLIYNEIFNRPA